MQYNLTNKQLRIEEEVNFKLRLAETYKGFANETPDSDARRYYQNMADELCDEATALGLQHQNIREHTQTETDLFIQQQLS